MPKKEKVKHSAHIVSHSHVTAKKESTAMYFRIDYPIELRKEILKAAIDTTQLLKRYESLKALSHLRSEVYQDFNKKYKELEILTRKLSTKDLPVIERVRSDVKRARSSEQKMMSAINEIPIPKPSVKSEEHRESRQLRQLSEDEKLDQELRLIQDRLKRLETS